MLYYKIDLAIKYRDALYKRQNMPNCSTQERLAIASEVLKVVAKISLLRAQLSALQDSHVSLTPPAQADIDAVSQAATAVETLVKNDAILAGALGLLGQGLSATAELERA